MTIISFWALIGSTNLTNILLSMATAGVLNSCYNHMRRTIKKEINLNKLKTGCSPCMLEAKKMEQKISNRKISEIKIEEVKTIVSSMFKKD